MSHPLDELLTFAERAYVRMEAEELISMCLEQGDPSPFNDLVQGLVLAGSSSLAVLQEILEEVRAAKSSLSQEGMAVRRDLMEALGEFGVRLPQLLTADAPQLFRRLCSKGLRQEVLGAAGRLAAEEEILLEEICLEAGRRVSTIAHRLAMLSKLEDSVTDWLGCLAYEASRSWGQISDRETVSPLH